MHDTGPSRIDQDKRTPCGAGEDKGFNADALLQKEGFVFERQIGSHRSYSKKGINRPVVIPVYKQVDPFIIRGLIRTARMTRDRYFEHLKQCR